MLKYFAMRIQNKIQSIICYFAHLFYHCISVAIKKFLIYICNNIKLAYIIIYFLYENALEKDIFYFSNNF